MIKICPEKKGRYQMWFKFLILLLALSLTGCMATKEPEADVHFQPVFEQTAAESFPPERDADGHRYYDFDDIPIPMEMTLNRNDSILFESQGVKVGMLTYTGRVDSDSLFNYFQVSMQNEGWRLLSYIKYGTQILTFDKDDRLCIIRIIEGRMRSELQIWVSPKIT